MRERTYRLTWGGRTPVECQARTKGEARRIFKELFNVPSGQRLRMKVRVRKAGPAPEREPKPSKLVPVPPRRRRRAWGGRAGCGPRPMGWRRNPEAA